MNRTFQKSVNVSQNVVTNTLQDDTSETAAPEKRKKQTLSTLGRAGRNMMAADLTVGAPFDAMQFAMLRGGGPKAKKWTSPKRGKYF